MLTEETMTLIEIFESHKGKVAHKYPIHLEAYDKVFFKFKDKNIGVVEIGIGNGGSLQLWRKYFGPAARIYGIDVVDLNYLESSVDAKIFVGSQGNAEFLNHAAREIGDFHILIDDGSHFPKDQIISFETLFPLLQEGGLYVCEDTHTSYREPYGGGLGKAGTFIEYLKQMIDSLHNSEIPEQEFPTAWRNVFSIHFYPSLVIIEKRSPWSWGGAEMRGAA